MVMNAGFLTEISSSDAAKEKKTEKKKNGVSIFMQQNSKGAVPQGCRSGEKIHLSQMCRSVLDLTP